MGILGLVCTRMPDIQLGIIFLPGVQFTADTVRKYFYVCKRNAMQIVNNS